MARLEKHTDPRVTTYVAGYAVTATVTLSERNLLILLSKLYTEGSKCTIVNGDVLENNDPVTAFFAIKAEKDEQHYAGESREGNPPGKMHPFAEAIARAVQQELARLSTKEATPQIPCDACDGTHTGKLCVVHAWKG